MSETKKFYWLRLKKDFFKRHDIRIIESMSNGKDYVLFYLKLLCESVDHDGNLRFSDMIPYNDEMLATITNTNIDIVRSAIKIFTELQLMDILDDGTLYMNEVQKMIGSATQDEHTRESTRLRVQAYRDRQKEIESLPKRYCNVTCNGEIEKEIEIELELEKEIEIDNKKKNNKKEKEPKITFGEYQNVKLTQSEYDRLTNDYGVDVRNSCIKFLDEYIEEKAYKSKSHNLAIRRWVVDAVNKSRKNDQKSMVDKLMECE